MIVNEKDVIELRKLAADIRDRSTQNVIASLHSLFGSQLYPVLACGFDEIRIEPLTYIVHQELEFLRETTDNPSWKWIHGYESRFMRQAFRTLTGVWYRFTGQVSFSRGGFEGIVLLRGRPISPEEVWILSIEEILDGCEGALTSPTEFGAVVLPNLWMPPEKHPSIELVDSTKALLLAMKKEEKGFGNLTWQQLEDIVAELLRARGMEVTITPRSRDGGRDLLARGELIPGEPTVLAIEVKHKGVVGVDEVASRLYRNKEFPTLMFATSGRFSAGVIREKKKPENFLRLFLKDGVALRQWIAEYQNEDG
jgi:hypothetical protein